MSMMEQYASGLAELALMGKFVNVDEKDNEDLVEYITDYIYRTFSCNDTGDCDRCKKIGDIYDEHIHKYGDTNQVTHIGVNVVEGMRTITFCLDTSDGETPKPFEEDYGSGYPCAFCYVLNYDAVEFSEFGDCFFEKRDDNYYHRVS